ncbi:MAG TPA: hypothetical protein VJJ21_02030 [Candidatus Nanoarchaeia archaeon]|nr:hypothetical protein [Candidatus Nanoarchaeia archaeon]
MSKRGLIVLLVFAVLFISGCQQYFGDKVRGVDVGKSGSIGDFNGVYSLRMFFISNGWKDGFVYF